MDRRIEDDVEGWPTRPIEGGYAGLRELASADFSGAVRARGATMFVLNGRIVGVFDGSLEDFQDADGTAHKAPHRSLPLLYAMQETGGETRAKYYTNETPISQVDSTLSEGGFTGFIELSENVLSGDYYVVYHAGRGMSLAFVGNSERLVTGEEAFELADDEVGIYEVNDVDLDIRDVPGLDGGGGGASGDTGAGGGAAAGSDGAGGEAAVGDAGASGGTTGADPDPTPARDPDPTPAEDTTESRSGDVGGAGGVEAHAGADSGTASPVGDDDAAVVDPDPAEADDGGATADPIRDAEPDRTSTADRSGSGPARGSGPAADSGAGADAGTTPDRQGDANRGRSDRESSRSADTSTDRSRSDSTSTADPATGGGRARSGAAGRGSEPEAEGVARGAVADEGAEVLEEASAGPDEETWREATTIPSLDPDRTQDEPPAPKPTTGESRGGGGGTTTQEPAGSGRAATQQRTRSTPDDSVEDTFEQEVLEREDRIDRLQQRVSNLEAERDDVARERDRLVEEVEELEDENEALRAEIRRLERDVEELEAAADDGGRETAAVPQTDDAGPQDLDPLAALGGTDVFVRYDSKGEPTLEDVHGGAVDAGEVNDNLRIDLHTRFDAEEATVGGEPFRAFLEETMGYRFVEWLVRALPFEIRDTGQQSALRDLYDALPEIDRVEFDGTVELTYEDAGEEVHEEETFDVVVRDRMGEPLVVANLNDSRDPATERMLVDLHEAASRVKDTNAALVGAFFVTRSFFEPEALETASEATSGSLLSRDSRRSYVKLSRKQGYHLCLVEARGEDLHLNQPEL